MSALNAFCLLCIDVRCVFLGVWVWGCGSHLSVCFVDDFCGVFRILVIGSVDVWFLMTSGGYVCRAFEVMIFSMVSVEFFDAVGM